MTIEALVDRLFWAGIASTIPLAFAALLVRLLSKATSQAKLWAIRIAFFKCLLLLMAWPRPLVGKTIFLPLPPGSFGPGTLATESWPRWLVLVAFCVSGGLALWAVGA